MDVKFLQRYRDKGSNEYVWVVLAWFIFLGFSTICHQRADINAQWTYKKIIDVCKMCDFWKSLFIWTCTLCRLIYNFTSMLALLTVGPKFTRTACNMQRTTCIARRCTALLMQRARPWDRQTDGQTDTAPFWYVYHIRGSRNNKWSKYANLTQDRIAAAHWSFSRIRQVALMRCSF